MIYYFRGQYAFLSNFHPTDLTYQAVLYPSAEHAFQASKANSTRLRNYIAALPTAAAAKRAGRQLPLREDWDEVKLSVMETICRIKFSDPNLQYALVLTAPQKLVEGNAWGDVFWGMCYENKKWVGENHLGKILMKIRKDMT